MNIVQEIHEIREQLDFIVKAMGDLKLFNFNSVKTDLEHAMSIIDSSKSAIAGLQSTVATHIATIAAQANTIATHEATIASMADASTEFGNFANTIHQKFAEYEAYLKTVANTVVTRVEVAGSVLASDVGIVIDPPAPVVEVNVPANTTPVSNVEVVAPVVVAANNEINPENLDNLFHNVVGTPHPTISEHITIGPLKNTN